MCVGAVKEMEIDSKLKGIIYSWVNQVLSFTRFKARGEVLLKVGEITETMGLLDDSLMIMNSLLTNR